tara:strand:- start:40 stop:333 length:294 start_codon:yes stop_codon:yes gene_type:complete
MTRWKKERLAEQLKFFGAKKTEFISVYAKKPRILCKAKAKQLVSASHATGQATRQAQLSALYQINRGIERGAFGFNQMTQAQSALYNGLVDRLNEDA